MQTLQPNATLQGGKYIIKKVLGQGGFGITYLAEHELLGTNVAIKEFFFKQYCERDEATSHVTVGTVSNRDEVLRFQEKFIKEARIIARLNHPNIIKIHDVFKENNTAYYVMDYIEGENLADMVNRRGAIPEAEAVGYICQAGEALAYIHNQHLNHLDVKPSNLMLRKSDGKVILIDFGMSKQYDSITGNQTSTTPIGISHGYAPIEQYKEGGICEFSPQTDVYALGATLYKLVTGNTPPQASEIAVDGWLMPFPKSVSDLIRKVITKSMEIRKKNRYNSVDSFIESLYLQKNDLVIDENKETTQLMINHSITDKQEEKQSQLVNCGSSNDSFGTDSHQKYTNNNKKTRSGVGLWLFIALCICFVLIILLSPQKSQMNERNTILPQKTDSVVQSVNNNQLQSEKVNKTNQKYFKDIKGNHLLSLQWISWDHFGTAVLTPLRGEMGKYECKGSQYNEDKTDWLIIDGTMTVKDDRHLLFEGIIKTKVSYIANGKEQIRRGVFDFVASGKRKYWRLQQMDNPGDNCVDYIDIYF